MIRDWRTEFSGRVVLTGGVACGKSTVLGVFKEAGISIASADDCVREIWAEDGIPGRVADAIGWGTPLDMGRLKLAAFADDGVRRALNTFFHGSVMERLAGSGALVCEIPLAFEAGVFGYFSQIVTVVCDRSDQVSRLESRGMSFEAMEGVLGSQLGGEVRSAASDWVIRTSCSLESVYEASRMVAANLFESRNLGKR